MRQRGAHARRVHAARWLLMAGGLAGLLAGCGSAAPLITISEQAGISSCTPAPNPAAGLSRWDSPFGESVGMYYNQSAADRVFKLVASHRPSR